MQTWYNLGLATLIQYVCLVKDKQQKLNRVL